jgi:hypothetical protein
MAIKELEDLYSLLSADDRTQFDSLLQRNQAAQAALLGRETVYQAFVTGDDGKLSDLAANRATASAAAASAARPTPASLDIAALDAELTRRVPTLFKTYLDSPDAQAAIDARAEAKAKALIATSTGDLIGRAMHSADEIYRIRRSHEREFGSDLDSTVFEKFVTDNPGKFASLTAAHDAFMQEKRIELRIEKGVADKLAAQHTNEVPGSSLPNSQTPLGAMIRDNAKRTNASGDVARGDNLDAAAKAFRELQSKHVM